MIHSVRPASGRTAHRAIAVAVGPDDTASGHAAVLTVTTSALYGPTLTFGSAHGALGAPCNALAVRVLQHSRAPARHVAVSVCPTPASAPMGSTLIVCPFAADSSARIAVSRAEAAGTPFSKDLAFRAHDRDITPKHRTALGAGPDQTFYLHGVAVLGHVDPVGAGRVDARRAFIGGVGRSCDKKEGLHRTDPFHGYGLADQ